MSFEDAVAALEGAVEAENTAAPEPSLFAQPEPVVEAPAVPAEQATAPSAPQGESATEQGAAPVEPVQPTAVDTFDGGKFNPDDLAPELRPAWQQLQAAFTRKTQDIAAERQQIEQLRAMGVEDFSAVSEAVQLYQQLQDPANWPRFQQEITQLMSQQGVPAPAAPVAPAAQAQPGFQTPPAPTQQGAFSELATLAETYPELAPLAQTVTSLQQELQSTRTAFEAQQHQMAVERQALAVQGEFQRQESVLRESGVNEKDMARIYEMAPSYNGNLLAANEALQNWKSDMLAEYLASKTQAQSTPVAPIGGAGVTSSVPQRPANLEQATDIALETLRAAGIDNFDF